MVTPGGPFYEENLVKYHIFSERCPIVRAPTGCELSKMQLIVLFFPFGTYRGYEDNFRVQANVFP